MYKLIAIAFLAQACIDDTSEKKNASAVGKKDATYRLIVGREDMSVVKEGKQSAMKATIKKLVIDDKNLQENDGVWKSEWLKIANIKFIFSEGDTLYSCQKDQGSAVGMTFTLDDCDIDNTGKEGKSFYSKYIFTNGNKTIEIIVKIDRNKDGELTTLHTIDTRNSTPIDSIPLEKYILVAGRAKRPDSIGQSFVGQGRIYQFFDDKTSIPKIDFTTFKSGGQPWRGEVSQRLTNEDWQKIANKRPKAPPYDEPQQLSGEKQEWLENVLNKVGYKVFQKEPLNRVITAGGKSYYGAVYRVWDKLDRCWAQMWGLDNVEVVDFLYELRTIISIKKSSKNDMVEILCDRDSDYDLKISCSREDFSQDQLIWRVDGDNLIIEGVDGSAVHMDSMGRCHANFPQP